jgi:hypothetical protein
MDMSGFTTGLCFQVTLKVSREVLLEHTWTLSTEGAALSSGYLATNLPKLSTQSL